jgi:hypothetical protein
MREKTTRRNFIFAGAAIASSLVATLARKLQGQVPSSPAKSAIPVGG